jgi:Circularly permutated YpsA SLOG family
MLKKIISGGQTGVDRAALDAAIRMGIPHGGWLPKGRITEDGPLPANYQLDEMPTDSYSERTEQNVIDSDGTLIISRGAPAGGTEYTRKMALKHGKQMLHIDLTLYPNPADAASLVAAWLKLGHIEILNVAGPRASKDPAVYAAALAILIRMV